MTVYSIPGRIQTIIFDIDSTLYTNDAYAREQIDVQLRRYAAIRGISEAEARAQVWEYREKYAAEHGTAVSLGNTLAAFGIPIETSIEWRKTLLEPQRFLGPDVRLQNVLAALSARFRLAAVTNNPVLPASKTLAAHGVGSFFPDIVGLDTCGVSKPHPEPFLLAAKKTDARPQNCLAVGDRYDIDIALPLELGMGGVLVTGVEDVYRLPALLLHGG